MKLIDARVLFASYDLWIGVYWELRPTLSEYDRKNGHYIRGRVLIVHICLVPMLPLKVRIEL